MFDAVKAATDKGIDVLIVDTAGRLQNKRELMDELAKIRRVLGRLNPEAPHDVVLVLDATNGQNALAQIEVFKEVAGVTGLVMTKLDGTARGGVLVAAAEQYGLPIHAIGVGEKIDDLRPFDAGPGRARHCRSGMMSEGAKPKPASEAQKAASSWISSAGRFRAAAGVLPGLLALCAQGRCIRDRRCARGDQQHRRLHGRLGRRAAGLEMAAGQDLADAVAVDRCWSSASAALTILLHDEFFIQIKPTVIYICSSASRCWPAG